MAAAASIIVNPSPWKSDRMSSTLGTPAEKIGGSVATVGEDVGRNPATTGGRVPGIGGRVRLLVNERVSGTALPSSAVAMEATTQATVTIQVNIFSSGRRTQLPNCLCPVGNLIELRPSRRALSAFHCFDSSFFPRRSFQPQIGSLHQSANFLNQSQGRTCTSSSRSLLFHFHLSAAGGSSPNQQK